jgi:NDP-sugar pyrophosphorylase family protein
MSKPFPQAPTPKVKISRAMILAAGLGTRLRPLTDERPKALVEIDGRTLLEITLARLRSLEIREVVINAHHFADMLIEYLAANGNFGMTIHVSREDVLLDTGGGLKKAAPFFMGNADSPDASSRANREEPILVHNVDVISTIDLARMAELHAANNALATLAVQDRETSRYLLFDEALHLCGRQVGYDSAPEIVRPLSQTQPLAFSGIHIISPRLFPMLTEQGAFSIVSAYLRLSAQGETIQAFRADEYYWRDLGRPEDLKQAAHDLKQPVFALAKTEVDTKIEE